MSLPSRLKIEAPRFMPATAAAVVITKCGAVEKSEVKSAAFAAFSTQSTALVSLPGSAFPIQVPSGETRCFKVRVSIIANCSKTAVQNQCSMLVGTSNVDFAPSVPGKTVMVPAGDEYGAYSFEFVARINGGSHTIRTKAAVSNAMTKFSISSWVIDVETVK